MHSRVSVIIPCYNAAPHLAAAIESVLAQTHAAHEIIVVDDGSTDDTAAIARRYVGRGVTLLTEAHGGVAAARNHGILAATGDLIAFLDADDQWLPHKLAVQIPLFADSSVGLVYSDMRFTGARSGRYQDTLRGGYHDGYVTRELLAENFIPTSTVVVRRALFSGGNFFREDPARLAIGEDYELWLRLSLHAALMHVAEPLVEYRVHAAQASASRSKTYACLLFLFTELARDPLFASFSSVIRWRRIVFFFKKAYYARHL